MAITFKKKYKDEMTGEWSCPVCDVRMESQHAFTVHIRQHNPTDHSHMCSICSKQLSSASSLDRHMLIHSGERPFKCRICNMAFTTNGNMHRHMRTHGQEQQAAVGYISSTHLDEDGLRVRTKTKKARKQKSLPNLNNSTNSPNTQSQNSSFGFDDLSIKEGFLALLQLQNQKLNGSFGDFNFDNLQLPKDNDFNSTAANFYSQLPKPLNQLNLSALKQLSKDNKLLNDELDDSEHRSTTSSDEQQENLLNRNDSYQEDEINKLALKRGLAQNSNLYNTLFNNNLAAVMNGSANNSTSNKNDLADINSILSVISNVPMLANVTASLQQLPLNDEQMAKFSQQIQQQTLQDQSKLLNNNNQSSTDGKQNGKRARNDRQQNGTIRNLTNGKRMKRDLKDNDEFNNLSSLNSLTNLKNSINSINSINSLNSINSILNGEDDQASDKSIKNGSDIENEMINGKQQSKNEQTTTSSSKSTTSQQLINSQLENDDIIEDDDNYSNKDLSNNDLSEEEEANKLEQELCEQDDLNKAEDESMNDDEKLNSGDDDEKKSTTNQLNNSLNKKSNNLIKNGLSSLIIPKKSTTTENLADLLIKSDKNNNKNMHNNNGSNELSNRLFIDPMVEEDVKLLEKQLQDHQYLCKICNLEVRSVNTLRRHQRLHDSGGQLYKCHYCTYTSLDKSSLIRHLRTHNGERPYQCTICKYAFTTKANCERHLRKRHKIGDQDNLNNSNEETTEIRKRPKKQNKNDILTSIQLKMNNSDSLISSLNGQSVASTLNDDKLNSVLDSIPPSSLVETNKSLLGSSNMHLIPHVFYEPNQMETSCRYCHVEFKFNRLLRQHLRTMCNNNFSKKPFNCLLCNSGFTTKNLCVRHIEKSHADYKKNNDNIQLQDLIIELNPSINNSLDTKRFNGNLNTSVLTTAFTNSTAGSGSELLSNCDSSELDQPLNLANGFYNSLNKLTNLSSSEKYMDDDEFDDEDNQDALDLSVKSNERVNTGLDQLNSLNQNSTNGAQLNDEQIRNAISTLLALQSIMPKPKLNENQQLIAQANSLLNGGQTMNSNMTNLLAAQQLQTNNSTPSLLNLFNSFI